MSHPDHQKQIKRINRIQGQLNGVRNMIEEQRYCPDILNQLKAVKSAIVSLQAEVLKTHLDHCVTEAMTSKNKAKKEKKIKELVELFKKS